MDGTVAVVVVGSSVTATVIPGSGKTKIPAPVFTNIDTTKKGSVQYSLLQKSVAGTSRVSVDKPVIDASGTIIAGITIDSATGIITIADDATTTISGTYTVYAEATGSYAGQQSADITITVTAPVERTAIDGTLSYGTGTGETANKKA